MDRGGPRRGEARTEARASRPAARKALARLAARCHADDVNGPEIHLTFASELHVFLPTGRRGGRTAVATDGSSTLGHVVESLGVPLTEAGQLLVDGRPVATSHIPSAGESVEVRAVVRPQRVPGAPLRFLLDVHLGTLARRMRLLGIDAAYESEDIGDPALATLSAKERRVMLSRDRGCCGAGRSGRGRTSTATARRTSSGTSWNGSPRCSPLDPLHGLQRQAGARRQGLGRGQAGGGHTAYVRRLRAVHGVRQSLLARRAPHASGGDRRGGRTRIRGAPA